MTVGMIAREVQLEFGIPEDTKANRLAILRATRKVMERMLGGPLYTDIIARDCWLVVILVMTPSWHAVFAEEMNAHAFLQERRARFRRKRTFC
jgi:hypothetical protein